MFNVMLPAPYPTFGAYMKQFGKNLAYAVPALVIVAGVGFMLNAAIAAGPQTYDEPVILDEEL